MSQIMEVSLASIAVVSARALDQMGSGLKEMGYLIWGREEAMWFAGCGGAGQRVDSGVLWGGVGGGFL